MNQPKYLLFELKIEGLRNFNDSLIELHFFFHLKLKYNNLKGSDFFLMGISGKFFFDWDKTGN